jgi:hypothetical protein
MQANRPALFRGRHFAEEMIVLCVRWHPPALGRQRADRGNLPRILRHDREGSHLQNRIRLLGHVEALPPVIRETCSLGLHVLDRFHIVAKMNEALDDVRAAETRKLGQAGHKPLLKKSRWCVFKRKENRTSQQKFCLRDLLRYNLQTVRAYLLKKDFQLWDYDSPIRAGSLLGSALSTRRCVLTS